MKTIYKCERCGKIFDDYEECDRHESEHWSLRRWSSNEDLLDSMTEYKEGQEEPNVIHVSFARWNREKGGYDERFGKYKLVSSYPAPLIIENE